MSDDTRQLAAYLAEFSSVGAFPTSLSGYGVGARRHGLELAALGAKPATNDDNDVIGKKPSASSLKLGTERWQQLKPFRIRDLQAHLNALEANAGTSGKLDAKTKSAWNTYARIFREARTELVPAAGGFDSGNWVWMNSLAFDGNGKGTSLKERASKARAASPKTPVAASKPASKPAASAQTLPVGMKYVATSAVQNVLLALGANKKGLDDGKFGPTTKNTWDVAANKRKLSNRTLGAKGDKTIAVDEKTFATLHAEATNAPPPPPEPVSAKDLVANTADVQQILINIGHDKAKITDGLYGPTTRGKWEASAKQRGLDPYMAKKSADGKQVTVREATYLRLKVDADNKVPPQPTSGVKPPPLGGSLWALPPSDVAVVTADQLGTVLGRLVQTKTNQSVDLAQVYGDLAKRSGLDPRIEQDPQGRIGVLRSSWTAIQALYDKAAPAAVTPKASPSQEEQAWAAIKKGSTAPLAVQTLRDGLNALIRDGRINHAPFEKGLWDRSLREYVLDALEIKSEPARSQWLNALTIGKLVSNDKKSLKLPPKGVEFFKAAAKKLAQAQQDAKTTLAGYTKVNVAEIIQRINALNVSSVKFDKNGDARVLGDAIATFFENTKTKAPSGDFLKQVNKDILVRNEILAALSNAVQAADSRASATDAFRAGMVNNALRESSASVTVDTLQQAILHTALRKQGGSSQKLYEAVKNTGAFDAPTRAAYTAMARTLTIGPAVLEFEKKLKAELGAGFKAATVEEVRNKVWGEFLDKALSKTGTTLNLKTLPALAKQIEEAAALYRTNVSADVRQQDKVRAQEAALADAVKKSTAIVSVFDAQQALLRMASRKQVKSTGIKVTGVGGDKATREGLFQVSSYIFPEGYAVPETMWMAYLKKVGINVVSGGVAAGWSGATNYIALPPALADIVSKRAGEYMAEKGVPAGSSSLAPLPLDNQELRLRFGTPSIVTAQRPAQKVDSQDFTKETASTSSGSGTSTSAGGAGGSSAGGSSAGGSAQTNITGPTLAPTFNITIPQQQAQMPANYVPDASTTFMPASGGGGGGAPASPEPAFTPSAESPTAPTAAADASSQAAALEPAPVVEAGVAGGSSGLLWLLGAGVVAAVAFKNKDGKTNTRAGQKPRRSQSQKRYSKR